MSASAIPDSIRPRVAQLVRLIGSPIDGEVMAAARALSRTLRNAHLDLHVLADSIEHPPTPLVVYVERKPRAPRADKGHVDWSSSYRIHVAATLELALLHLRLSEWERSFVGNVVQRLRSPYGKLTFKQAEVAQRLVARMETAG